jgi:hypothetical protein
MLNEPDGARLAGEKIQVNCQHLPRQSRPYAILICLMNIYKGEGASS